MRKYIGLMSAILVIGMVSLSVKAGALFWDTSTAAGYQGGDGRWTVHPADTNWSSDGLVRKPFVNNEDAIFLDNDGPSGITMDGGVFSNNSSSVRGANYTIIMTNGAQLTCTYAGGADFFLGYGTNWGRSASNTWIVAAGTPTAPTMLKTSRTGGYTMYIGGGNGNGSYSNVLIVDGGGVLGSAMVTNSGATMVGAIGAVACGIDVRREGLFYSLLGGIQVGVVGSTNCFIRSDGAEIRTTALSLYGDFASANFLNGSRYYDSGAAGLIVGGGGWATNCSLVIDNSQVTHGGYGDFKISGNNSWGVITNGGYLNLAGGNYRYIGETASNCSLRVVGGGPNSSVLTLGANVLTVGLLGGKSNEVWVDGQGVAGSAVMTNGFVTVGSGAAASGNRLVITNSGRYFMSAGAGTIGSSASANRADVVGGPGVESVWNGGNQAMTIGNLSSSFNLLVIDGKGGLGSAVMTNIGSLAIGFNGSQASPSTMNAVIVTNGGALYLGAGANFGHGALAHGIGVIGGNVYAATSNRLEIVQGGRVYSSAALFIGFNYYNGPLIGNRLIVRDSDSLLDMRGYGIEAPHSYPQNAICISGVELLIDAGVVTNVAGLILPNRLAGNLLHDNRLIVTNGGKFYMTAAGSIGTTGGSNNVAVISGSNSLWTLGGAALTVGAAGYSNNVLIIDQGGTVDNVGTLTLAGGFNFLNLRGGTLGAATTTYTNGLFTAGDGVQSATLKSLAGGTLSFTAGLLITNTATLAGVGTVGGGSVGVILTNGATLSPGINGPGSLTIGGSNLNWAGGGVYQCEVTDLNLGFGVGWDVLNVSSQLVFAGTSPKFVLKIDSKGAAAAGFNPALNYTLKILTYGSLVGYDTNLITLDTSAFSTVPASTWYLTNFNNSVYLAYDGTSPLGDANLVWKVPSNGNWNVAGNWAGGVAPDAGGNPANVLNFGDNGTRYFSTNNLTGTFQLNKLVLASISTVTNLITGSNLAFTVNGATAPRLEFQTGGGTYIISNALSLDTGMVFGGDGGGTLVLASNVVGGQPLVKQGPWTLALAGSNVFADPVVVTNLSMIRLDSINAIGSSSLIVSNGGKLVNTAGYTFGNSSYRSALVTGNDSYWTNGSLTVGTNAQVTIDGGRLAINGALTVADRGTVANSLTVTNGGRIAITGEFVMGTGNIDNNALIAAGGQVYALGNTRVGNNAGGHRNSLVVRGTDALLDGGARNLYVGYHASASLYSNSMTIADNAVVANCMLSVGGGAYNNYNSLTLTNGGKLFTKSAVTYIGSTGSSNSVAVIGGGSASLWDNGGQQLTIGLANNSSNNSLMIDGTGAGAVVTNVGLFQVGGTGAGMGNRLIVTNGGVLVYGSPGLDNNGVGYASSNNTFAIAMGGKVYARGAITYVGEYAPASSNSMSVRDPGSLFDAGGGKITLGAYNNSAMGNLLLIDNSGVVSNCAVNVGSDFGSTAYYSTWNSMVITNGGKLSGVSGANNTIGGAVGGSFNSVTLYSNSTWNVAGGSLIVGQGTNNSLNLQDGGLVTNAASVYVGYNSPGARFNSLIITNGGKLYSTAVSGIGHAYLTAPAFGQSSNSVVVSGPNSLWSLGGANLTIGYTAPVPPPGMC